MIGNYLKEKEMTPDHVFTLIVSSVGIGGTLCGITVTHLLSKTWQRRQWELDNIKNEARELLIAFNALVPAYTIWARRNRLGIFISGEREGERESLLQAYSDKSVAFHSTLRDRLFITFEVTQTEILTQWTDAMKEYETDYDESLLEARVDRINLCIVWMVHRKVIKPININFVSGSRD